MTGRWVTWLKRQLNVHVCWTCFEGTRWRTGRRGRRRYATLLRHHGGVFFYREVELFFGQRHKQMRRWQTGATEDDVGEQVEGVEPAGWHLRHWFLKVKEGKSFKEGRRGEVGGRLGTASPEHSGRGHGVKRGEGVRKYPAAPLRTGYPARKRHLSPRSSPSLWPSPKFPARSRRRGGQKKRGGVAFHCQENRRFCHTRGFVGSCRSCRSCDAVTSSLAW